MTNAQVERADESDAPRFASIDDESDAWSVEAFASTLARAATHAFRVGHRGFVMVSIAGGEGEILRIVVGSPYRRQGLGRALLHHAQGAFIEHGVTEAFLEVRSDNVAARKMYAAQGWSSVGTRHRYYADGTDALILRWVPSLA